MIAVTNHQPQVGGFPLGQTVATPGALDALAKAGQEPSAFLSRHVRGDWGEISDGDRQMNDEGVIAGDRLLSAYTLSTGVKIWVITEADRSATSLILPEEY